MFREGWGGSEDSRESRVGVAGMKSSLLGVSGT